MGAAPGRDARGAGQTPGGRAQAHLDGPGQERWLDAVAAELDDVRAALSWALAGGDTATGLACAATLYRYWYVRAVREGRRWLDRLLAKAAGASPKILAKALYAAGELASDQGDYAAARSRHEHALKPYQELGHRRGQAWALHGLGIAEWGLGRTPAAGQRLHAALRGFRELGDTVGVAFALQYAHDRVRASAGRGRQRADRPLRRTHRPSSTAHTKSSRCSAAPETYALGDCPSPGWVAITRRAAAALCSADRPEPAPDVLTGQWSDLQFRGSGSPGEKASG